MAQQRHVIFGAGQVGSPLAQMLLDRGHEVRVVKRTPGGIPNGATALLGDASDAAFCASAAEGATTVYHCMNPPYITKMWAELVPRYMSNVIAASSRSGARLVVLDNVYALGKPNGRPLTNDTPMNPCSRKGEIRAQATRMLFDAHRRGDVRGVFGRASDFYGPGGTLTQVGDYFWPRVLAGRSGQMIADLDAIHTYHFIPDVAAGLATLGSAPDDALGTAWMLPCRPAESLRALVQRFEVALGRPIRMTTIPAWMQSLLGIVMPPMREMAEMRYQWAEPFIVDDSAFRARFAVEPETVERAAAATVAWARRHYARS